MSNNRRYIATAIIVVMSTAMALAQRIAVVTAEGTTSVCQTLQQAIENAVDGDVIYLPGGGFQISEDVKITKKVSIVGIGYKPNSENTDGNTVISGDLYFNEGSTGSSVMGCYISNRVFIGYDGAAVHNIVFKYCDLGNIYVKDGSCTGTVVNQSYLRGTSYFNSASATLTNNVISSVSDLVGGIVKNNVFKNGSNFYNCSISRNIFLDGQSISNCTSSENMNGGEAPVDKGELEWDDLFVKYNNGAVTPSSNFHIADEHQTQFRHIGIDGGSGFEDSGQPPLPFFMAKEIDGQTDASENLNIKIRVKSGENK